MASVQHSSFGALLRHHRLAAGLTLEELAAIAGLSAKGISALERGERQAPRKETVLRLAKALQLTSSAQALLEAAARQRRASPDAGFKLRQVAGVAHYSATLSQLMGRVQEQSLLQQYLAGERAPTLLFSGEPGIGKSRLLQEAGELARARGWMVLTGGCHRRSGEEPFTPFVGALATFLQTRSAPQLRLDLDKCAWLARLLPELAELRIIPAPSWMLPPLQERRLMFAAVTRLLANIAGPAGTLLILDDLQWAGQDALDLLGHLSRTTIGAPLRIIGAYRDTELRGADPLPLLLTDLEREGLAAHHMLEPLAQGEAEALLSTLLSTEDGSPTGSERTALLNSILERAGGVPFFLISCAHEARVNLLAGNDVWATGSIPVSAADSIRQRIAVLSIPGREVLTIAAVSGREVSRPLLFKLTTPGHGEDKVLDALDEMVRARLLYEEIDGTLAVAHDLIRETVLADLSAARRTALHRRIAGAVEEQPLKERHAAELAWRFAEGDEPARALPYALQAGDQAEKISAHTEAKAHFWMAIDLARKVGDKPHEAQALERLADVLWGTGNFREILALLESAADIRRRLGDLDQFAWDIAHMTRPYTVLGQSDVAFARLYQLLVYLDAPTRSSYLESEQPREGDSSETFTAQDVLPEELETLVARAAGVVSARTAGRIYNSIVVCLVSRKRFGQAIPLGEGAVRYTQQAGQSWLEVRARMFLADALVGMNRPAEAVTVMEAARLVAREAGDLEGICLAEGFLADRLLDSGAFTESSDYRLQALKAAEEYGGMDALVQMYVHEARIALYSGDWDETLSCGRRAGEVMATHGFDNASGHVMLLQGMISVYRGEIKEAHEYLDAALGEGENRSGATAFVDTALLEAHSALAEAALLQGDNAAALARLEPWLQHTSPYERVSTPLLPFLAWAYLDRGDTTKSAQLLVESLEHTRRHHYYLVLVETLRIQALLALSQDRYFEAEAALEEATGLARRIPYPYAEAKLLYAYGKLYSATGRRDQALEQLRQALALCLRLGERLYRNAIEAELG